MEKEKWIEATLRSADGMSRAEAPDIIASVQARIGGRQVTMTVTSGTLWRIAASVALLVALNITTLISSGPSHHEGNASSSEALLGLTNIAGSHADVGELFFGNEVTAP